MRLKLISSSQRWRWCINFLTGDGGVWLGLALLIYISIYGQFNVRRARVWVSHTFDVLDAIQQVETNLFNAELHLRSFLATKTPQALNDYQQTVASTRYLVATLERLTVDNPSQQRNLQRFETLLDQQLRQQQERLQSPAGPPKIGSSTDFLLFTDAMHTQLTTIEQTERSLLEERRATADRLGIVASALAIGGASLSIVALLIWRTSQARQRQKQAEIELSQRLQAIALEQELNSHLLTCRNLTEAHDILQSVLEHLLPDCPGAIYEINNSRDQMLPSVKFGGFALSDACFPRECWALRRGEVQMGQQTIFDIPCTLCDQIHCKGQQSTMMCLPLQAHEQTIGILHLSQVSPAQRSVVEALARQIALPLAMLHLQAELEYLSFHDANTGIYNRRFLDEMLSRAIASAKRQNYRLQEGAATYSVGVIFMDVDHFKRFNSEHGHEIGDAVLRTLGALLVEITRAGEDIPCRYGGEEFVLVMPGASEGVTLAKAERIREGIKQRPAPTGATISLSLGVALYPKHGSTPEEVLKAANIALLQAKAEGRDRVLVAN